MPRCDSLKSDLIERCPCVLPTGLVFLALMASGAQVQASGPQAFDVSSAAGVRWEFKPEGGEWKPILVPAGGWKTQGFVKDAGIHRTHLSISEADRVQVDAPIMNDSDRPARVKLGGRFTDEANYPSERMLFSTVHTKLAPAAAETADSEIQREPTEWLDITVAATQDDTLPRVLLIGDSITRLYYPKVQELLRGKANVARLSTSKSAGDPALIGEIAMLLQQYRFDIIQISNGMHGWAYTEDQYAAGLKQVHDVIRRYAPQAKIIVASTTPVRVKGDLPRLDPKTERVRQRNLALKSAFPDAVSFDDIFSLILPHPEDYTFDGVHPNEAGAELEATQVSAVIRSFLP